MSKKHKGNHSCEGVFICDKTDMGLHKTFVSNFLAHTTSIYQKFFCKQIGKMGVKCIVFEAI